MQRAVADRLHLKGEAALVSVPDEERPLTWLDLPDENLGQPVLVRRGRGRLDRAFRLLIFLDQFVRLSAAASSSASVAPYSVVFDNSALMQVRCFS